MIHRLVSKGLANNFLRGVSVLMGGTAAAQAILLIALPFLTRLYSPQDFSVLAVYVSAVSILSISACLRLEIAVPLPADDTEAASLLVVALAASAVIAALTTAGVLLVPGSLDSLIGRGELGPYLWLVPIGVWLASTYSALQYWSTRKRRFSDIAKTKLTQSIGGTGVQVGLGWLGLAPFGLLLGHAVIGGAGVIGLAARALRHERAKFQAVRISSIATALRNYRRFPLYSTWDALANTSGLQVPVIIIAAVAVGPEAGLLMLAMRTMQAPMALIGTSVGQVFLSEAPEKERQGQLPAYSTKIMASMARIGAGPLVFAGFAAPAIFGYAFGPEWADAGHMVSWMVPWFILQFVSSPVSMLMHVLQLQGELLVLTIFGLVCRAGGVALAAMFSPQSLVEAFALGSALFYLILTVIIVRRAGCRTSQVLSILRSGGVSAICGCLAGIIFLAASNWWSL